TAKENVVGGNARSAASRAGGSAAPHGGWDAGVMELLLPPSLAAEGLKYRRGFLDFAWDDKSCLNCRPNIGDFFVLTKTTADGDGTTPGPAMGLGPLDLPGFTDVAQRDDGGSAGNDPQK